jgi:hypothetical protein
MSRLVGFEKIYVIKNELNFDFINQTYSLTFSFGFHLKFEISLTIM